MRKDKDAAFVLRKEGKSYKEIEAVLGISRSTLCNWFRNESWSKHVRTENIRRTWSPEHIKLMQSSRVKKLDTRYEAAETEAVLEYETYKNEPLFWAGLMVYGGEGDKRSKYVVRVTSSEFYLHKIFIAFAQKYLGVERTGIKCGLIIDQVHNENLCREMWHNLLGIQRENFHKTHVIQGKENKRRLQYGVAMSIISSTVLKKKITKWLSLAQDERFNNAVMV